MQKKNIIKLGNIYGDHIHDYAGTVYGIGGVCPALLTMQGGNRQPFIIEIFPKKEEINARISREENR